LTDRPDRLVEREKLKGGKRRGAKSRRNNLENNRKNGV